MPVDALPTLGVGAVVRHQDAILLVRRGRSPFRGEWAIPGGRVRLGESLKVAAERELLEETGVVVDAGDPAYVFEHVERDGAGAVTRHYVVVDLWANLVSGVPRGADDADEARWVRFAELPELPINAATRAALATLFPDHVS